MSQPGRLLHLFTTVLSQSSSTYTGSVEVDEVIRTLSGLDLARLLKHVRDWNVNARTSPIAQRVLHAILRLRSPEEIIKAYDSVQPDVEKRKEVTGLREVLDGLIPYSERHFARIDRLVQDSYVLDYVVGEMDGGMFGGAGMDVDIDGIEA